MSRDGRDRNDEIISLLNIIGRRLIDSEQERSELKETVDTLESRANENEKIYLSLKGQLSKRKETEDDIHKKYESFEKKHNEFESWRNEYQDKIEKAANLSDKIEEIVSQQNRLFRRMDQITQDRARVTRKLERIEETVLDTKTALEAKAMVLLTEQAEAAKNAVRIEKKERTSLKPAAEQNNDKDGLWNSPQKVRVAAIALLLGASFLTGLTITKVDGSSILSIPSALQQQASSYTVAQNRHLPFPADAQKIPLREIKAAAESVPEESAAYDVYAPLEKTAAKENEAVGYDTETLLAQFNENPDSLAASLNKISPAAGPVPAKLDEPATRPEETAKPVKQAVQTNKSEKPVIEKVALTPARKPLQDAASVLRSTGNNRPLSERQAHDSSLPPVIKEIETKAFEGIPEAQHDLAAIYTAGHGGVKVDYQKAAFWFTEAARGGVANAGYNLGVLYHQGLGVPQDTDIAISWYKEAAKLGHPEAQYNLGIAYIEGIGTEYDPHKAAQYFEQSANSGIVEAAYNLGLVHENGLLGEIHPEEALYWYKKAANEGSKEAGQALKQLSDTLGIDQEKIDSLLSELETLNKSEAPVSAPATPEKQSAITPEKLLSAGEVIKTVSSLSTNDREGPETGSNVASEKGGKTEVAAVAPVKNEQAILAQIQEQLLYLGLYPGPADGRPSALSEDAIRSYQSRNGLPVNGKASEEMLAHILAGIEVLPEKKIAGDMPETGDIGSRNE